MQIQLKQEMIQSESKTASTELGRCFAQLVPALGSTLTSPSKNTYGTFRRKAVKDMNPPPTEYIFKTTKDTQVNQSVKNRLNILRYLPEHENVVPITAKGHCTLKKQVYVLSQFFQGSSSLETIMESGKQLKMGTLNCIFYQVVRAMKFLEENKVNHLRLNPSSVLVKFPTNPNSTESPVVRICDFGLSTENMANYPHKYCLHSHFFDQSTDIYSQSYEECVKYDLWALGSIIYYCFKSRKPFYGKEKFFSDSMIFKTKHVLAPQNWLAKDPSYSLTQSFLFQRFIARCWGIKNKPVFKNWAEALAFYELTDYLATEIEKTSIFEIYNNHVSLMFLLAKIYILLREELQYQITKLTKVSDADKDKERKEREMAKENIGKLSLFVFKFSLLYHTKEFPEQFMNRSSVLRLEKRMILTELTQYIQAESVFLKNSGFDQKQYSFDYLIENVENRIVEFKLRCKSMPKNNITPKVKLLWDFFDEFLLEIMRAKQIMHDGKRDRSELLNVLYKSEALQKRAKSCGFDLPTFPLISEN